MGKYIVRNTTIMHDGEPYRAGDVIELTDKEAAHFRQFKDRYLEKVVEVPSEPEPVLTEPEPEVTVAETPEPEPEPEVKAKPEHKAVVTKPGKKA